MTDVTSSPPRVGGTTGTAATTGRDVKIMSARVNIADYAATVATGETIDVVTLAADTYFELIQAECVTAVSVDATTQRVDIGDTEDDNQFVDDASTVTAGTNMTIATPYTENGRVSSTGTTIKIKLTGDKLSGGTADATGIIRLVWLQGDAGDRIPASAGTI